MKRFYDSGLCTFHFTLTRVCLHWMMLCALLRGGQKARATNRLIAIFIHFSLCMSIVRRVWSVYTLLFFHCWWWCSLKCDNFEWNLQFVRNVVGSMCLFLHSQNVTHQLNGCFVYRLNNAFFIASLHFIKIAWKHSAGTDGRQRERSRMVKKMRIFNRDREEIDALLN